MDQFSYFHLCDHRIRRTTKDGEVTTLPVETSPTDLIHTVINGAIVLELLEIRASEYDLNDAEFVDFHYDNGEEHHTYDDVDSGEGFYDDKKQFIVNYGKYFQEGQSLSDPLPSEFFEPILHNRIRWNVKPPTKYQVKARVLYTHDTHDVYRAAQCPVCGGKGWFVDLLNKDGQFEQPKGILRIAQRIVKDLLTDLGTHWLDSTYGTSLKKQISLSAYDDDKLFDTVRMVVSEVEDRYLTNQQNFFEGLAMDEILTSLITDGVFRSSQNPTIILLQLRIRTMTDEQVFQLGV